MESYFSPDGLNDATVRAAAGPALSTWAKTWMKGKSSYQIFSDVEQHIPEGQLFP